MLIAETFRMGGHATHDEREARETLPAALFEHWGRRDPIGMYEEYLKTKGFSGGELERAEQDVVAAVDNAERVALASRDHMPSGDSALTGVYAGADPGATPRG